MRIFYHIVASASLFVSVPILAEESDTSTSEAEALQLAMDRGLKLYRYDQAAWHTTDALREDMEDLNNSGIQGWVVTIVDSGLLVTFWKPDGDTFSGVYSAVWDESQVTERKILSDENTQLNEEQIKLISAYKAVDDSKLERCSGSPFNVVVLPSAHADEPILVYLLTPQTSSNSIPLGGHYRFAVDLGKVTGKRKFMKSCFDMPIKEDKINEAVAFGITHFLDPVPTEIHIFSVFAAKKPIHVITTQNDSQWVAEVSGGQPRVRKLVEN